jgi:hypothetical protein
VLKCGSSDIAGDRYWVVQILWDSERPNSPIPDKYLPH